VIAHSDPALLDLPLTTVNGTHAAVVYDDVWYGATILKQDGDTYSVRYLGYDHTTDNGGFSFPDEEVSGDMIDLPGGDVPIDVEQNGTWYAARVIERNGRQWRIDYIGYDEEETVPRSRVRFPFGPPAGRGDRE
jgi:outer membrane biogenesis lipoprotein LolB